MPQTIQPGETLGPYRITAQIGEGGMGEVFKAIDTRLDRTVAIKAVRGPFSDRFQREAKAIASLNHPHICTLYDVGPDYLVMEFIDGKPLKGPLPLDEALHLARQIAEALDAAHRKGLAHRDLKPANVLVTKSGVKLLDFGLAKSTEKVVPGPDDATRKQSITAANTIVGTMPYMAPEQLEGKDADTRSDIFAFGAVLYELITGQRAFSGESQASLITAIMSGNPPSVSVLAPLTPPALDRIIRRCLMKDPEERWQSARDLREALDLITTAAPMPVTKPSRQPRWPFVLAGVAMLLAAAFAFVAFRPKPQAPVQEIRFQINPPPGAVSMDKPLLSKDGRQLAFTASVKGESGLWVRPLADLTARALPGTEGAWVQCWSPDGRSLLFIQRGKLMRIDITGGRAKQVAETNTSILYGSDWKADGMILTSLATNGPIQRIPAAGGTATPVTRVDTKIHSGHGQPQFFPDGRRFLYVARGLKPEDTQLRVGSLDRPPEAPPLAVKKGGGRVLFGSPSYLFGGNAGQRTVRRIDPATLQLEGEPIPIGDGSFTAESTTLAYSKLVDQQAIRLAWHSREGKLIEPVGEPRPFMGARASPDGARIVADVAGRAPLNLWMINPARGTTSRFTFSDKVELAPLWSPDGKWVAYSAWPADGWALFRKPASGAGEEEQLTRTNSSQISSLDWSRDGRFILYGDNLRDLWILPLEGDRKPFPFLATTFLETGGVFSSDSRWIAYISNESGRSELYVRDFSRSPAPSKGKWQISTGGAGLVRWRSDGRELFFLSGRRVIAVPVLPSSEEFLTGPPKPLFVLPAGARFFDISPDGNRLLLGLPTGETTVEPFTVILNWKPGSLHTEP